ADEPVILHREDDRLRGAVLGDLDPTRPGREAVTAGYTHRLTVLASAPGGWHPVFVHQDSDTLHHVAKGEFDGDPATAEIVAVGFSGNVTVLRLAGRPR
ncbi:MAG: hypothetical protein KDE27_10880, partial [Planctomycetes bacterium]|nr:hypothetical protein [Planctomycetota bacterium]